MPTTEANRSAAAAAAAGKQGHGDVVQQHPMLPVPDALRIVLRETGRILINGDAPEPNELISLSSNEYIDLVGRIVASDVVMVEPGYPPYNASIMDGYAIKAEEFTASATSLTYNDEGEDSIVNPTHRVVDKVYAGDEQRESIDSPHSTTTTNTTGDASPQLPTAYYITTGAVVPEGYNCVVPIEEVRDCPSPSRAHTGLASSTSSSPEKLIRIVAPAATIKDQEWIRPIGCDIPASSTVLRAGHVIDPIATGLLIQSGVSALELRRPTKVGVLSTGNELITVDDNITTSDPHIETNRHHHKTSAKKKVGTIPDVNRPILLSLLASYGRGRVEPIDLGMVRDDSLEDMTSRIQDALKRCDVIITTGGISMGETDIVKHVLVDKCGGNLHFGRMMMKPGKPTTFVTVPFSTTDGENGTTNSSTKIVFALPGNPVSATVCTQLLVKPCLDLYFDGLDYIARQAKSDLTINDVVDEGWIHPEVMAELSHDIKLDARPEYHRVTLEQSSDGSFVVCSTGVQRSSRLLSLRDSTGLLVLPSASGTKKVAAKGEKYLVLVLNYTSPLYFSVDKIRPVRTKDSIHLKKQGKQMKVGVVEVLPTTHHYLSRLDETCSRVQNALSGSNSGNAAVVWKKSYTGSSSGLYDFVANDSSTCALDLIIVVCVTYDGSFPYNVEVAAKMKQRLMKSADAMALQARKGAAAEDPTTAVFEVTVGYMPENDGSMIVCVPDRGLHGALSNIRGLLKHGLNLARGKPHNHHHTHKDHDHER